EVLLADDENTPLAVLHVREVDGGAAGWVWLSGPVRSLRMPEYGPGREFRFAASDDLSGATVAVFSPVPSPADLLRAVRESDGGPLHLVAEGSADRAESAALVQSLSEAAELLPDAAVHFVPAVDFGDWEIDVTAEVLAGRGARSFLDFRRPSTQHSGGAVILFTGLSGSGKSTIARALADHLAAHSSRRAVLLDGDHVRRELASELGFSAEDRHRNLVRQAWVGARVAEAGGIAICAPIAPFAASRAAMRAKVEPASPFFVVYVSTPLAVAEARDRKGLYAKARAGLIRDFTGIDSPYEVPEDADLVLDASNLSVGDCVTRTVALLKHHTVL
ncbi:MAG: adenylyl-sulfate kinase, partial [Rhodococcus sp. (in: high G+C Gram-positive bacteria)]|nr:adenylyl-sulfate kinase [Rhodococcus sp. (in: high G+C Gram-positive bacteria)]